MVIFKDLDHVPPTEPYTKKKCMSKCCKLLIGLGIAFGFLGTILLLSLTMSTFGD